MSILARFMRTPFISLMLIFGVCATASAATFTVTNVNDGGAGSLRQAIVDANALPGSDTINFSIGSGVQTIAPLSPLPIITDPVSLDATTQPGYSGTPLIELNGASAGSNAVGIRITAGASVVQGFVINRFRDQIGLETGGGNRISGNFIGTDVTGTMASGFSNFGIYINNSADNLIGGTTTQARNVISGGNFAGINITNPGPAGNQVQGNFIGTSVNGTTALGNRGSGVMISGPNNLIGGTATGARNIISANNDTGVEIFSGAGSRVQGNYIGTDVTGTIDLGNREDGVSLNAPNNLIGGTVAEARNVISGNGANGLLTGGSLSIGNQIQGNYVGTNAAGTGRLGNSRAGIHISSAVGNTIGGASPGAGNVISGNALYGVEISGNPTNDPNRPGNQVQGNFIGTNAAGTAALPNTAHGIQISFSRNNTIGGTTAGARNLISGNTFGSSVGGNGIHIDNGATGNVVLGNFIGTDINGTAPIPNAFSGVAISSASGNIVGGTAAGAANHIAYNGLHGVSVAPNNSSVAFNNRIRGNSIFSNTGLGIDLNFDGATPNDEGDTDAGGNNLQNFPALLSVSTGGGTTTAQGTLNSAPNASYVVELFASSSCDPSAQGEGQFFLGETTANTDASGNATFIANLPHQLAPGQVVTATATDTAGNTSEFSVCNEVDQPGRVQFSTSSYTVNEGGGSAVITVVRTLGTAATASVAYATSDGTAAAGDDYTPVTGTLFFAPGETTKTFTIQIANDSSGETSETVNLTLSNPAGSMQGSPGAAVLTIEDDDPVPALSVNNFSVIEDTPGGGSTAVFTVRLSVASNNTVTVEYVTSDGTATPNSDYVPVNGQLTFAPGETAKTINVQILADTDVEPNESFLFILTNARNATLPFFPATGIIRNNDNCSYAITPSSQTSPAAGETFTVNVTAPAGCAWTAISNSNFITVTAGAQGSGNGVVTLAIAANASGLPRSGAVSIAGLIFSLSQPELAPQAPSIQFNQSASQFSEADPRATFTITRTGDSSAAATVDYRTTDSDTFTVGCADTTNNSGGAYARCDFATTVGSLSFAPGETQKTITVPLIDDGHVEGSESFQVQLVNVTGAGLGPSGVATVSIADNDATGATNPVITSTQFFVRQQYLDFLSREPDQSGFDAWVGLLGGCANIFTGPDVPSGCDRIFVSGEGFFRSQEFQLKGFYVFRFYKAAFDRLPEYTEIVSDMSYVAGQTAEEVYARKAQLATRITQRQEFQTAYGGMTNAQYVAALMNRYNLQQVTTPDPAQPDGTVKVTLTRAELTDRLDAGTLTRAQVLRAVADSEAVGASEFNNAFVGMQYYGYLRRKPDEAGFRAWLGVLQRGDVRTMVDGFLNSVEYKLRFGQP